MTAVLHMEYCLLSCACIVLYIQVICINYHIVDPAAGLLWYTTQMFNLKLVQYTLAVKAQDKGVYTCSKLVVRNVSVQCVGGQGSLHSKLTLFVRGYFYFLYIYIYIHIYIQ